MVTREQLLEQLGDARTNRVVERFARFAHISDTLLSALAGKALNEVWGQDLYVLRKYLAVHVSWAIEQSCFSSTETQWFVSAGHLQTRYGTPLFLVFEENRNDQQPWYCVAAGADIGAPEMPSAPRIPEVPQISPGSEIVMMHDHILGDNSSRVSFLRGTPPVAQMCAVAGAIQWSINRGLLLPYWYFGQMQFLAPLYLQDREDITQAPDAVAPIQVNPNNLVVRTVLTPAMPYANARVSVHRHDQLPPWMLSAWTTSAAATSASQIDDPEAR